MNILIVNQPPFNRGDESAHKGLIRTIIKQFPGVQIRVMCPSYNAESIRQYRVHSECVSYITDPMGYIGYGFLSWHGLTLSNILQSLRPSFKKYKRIYEWADVVLCAPGGICMGGFQDWDHLNHLALAKIFKKPLVYYGRSFGPFPTETEKNRAFKKLSLEMLHYFSFLSIRDHKTELLADEFGIPYVSTVDSAFLDSPQVEIPYEVLRAIGSKPYMVFVPNYLLWHYAYKGRIRHETVIDFYSRMMDVIWKVTPEINIVMLPQLFGGNEYPFIDVEFFRELAKGKNDSRVIVLPDCYSSDIQQTIIRDAKYVIGARYHSIVFSINQGVPCVALSYEHKINGLLESIGKTEWCVDFSKALDTSENQEKCLEEVQELISNLSVDTNIQLIAKNKANACFEKFLAFLNEKH